MSKIFVGESGRTFRVNANFDLSGGTDAGLVFVDPNGKTLTKMAVDGVVVGTSAINDADLGVFNANEYVTYEVEVGVFDVAGRWCVQVIYLDEAIEPKEKLYGTVSRFTVHERC